ncbi:MAG: PAS domain-containing protein, partial [Vibrio sp.]
MMSPMLEQHSHLDSLEDQVERYKQVLDVMPAGVILLDTQGIVREANPEAQRLLDISLVGEKWYSVIQV